MKAMLVMIVAVSLVLAPYASAVNAKTSPSAAPPIEQPLVREGDFAVKLANALNINTSSDEAAAESALSSIGIEPRNGWIADYPITPDIIAEVRGSTARATSSGNLKMAEAEAAGIVDKVGIDMKLPVNVAGEQYSYSAGAGSEYAAPPADVGLYDEEPAYVANYYDEYGPPVVTYYPPPWDYYWLYDWVPWPFWWGGFGFGGFFVLGDFDVNRHGRHFSNHFRNANGTWSRVDAGTRSAGKASSSFAANRSGQGSGLNSPDGRAGARALVNRATGTGAGNRFNAPGTGSNSAMGNTGRSFQDADRPSFSGRSFSSAPSMHAFSGGGFSGGGFRGGGFSGGGGHGGGGRR
ncbi:MAG: hypothetical protein WB930_00580 [Syntrophobacteraceae bacterium]